MLFTFEALEASHGDCLLIATGSIAEPSFMLVDGGPRGVYRKSLSKRLKRLQSSIELDQPVPLRLVVISHIDDDHIRGVLDLAKATVRDSEASTRCSVEELWHNTLEDVLGGRVESRAAASALGGTTGLAGDFASRAIVESIGQSKELHELARRLDWLNPTFRDDGGLVRSARIGGPPRVVDDVLSSARIIVLGPQHDQLEAMHEKWRALTGEERVDGAEALARRDRNVFNLSSIVLVVETPEGRILLTGDARCDGILEGLDQADLFDARGIFHCDILKMPHHGSAANATPEFFERVRAENYVISANGKHGHPDDETLGMLTEARGSDGYVIWMTNAVDAAREFLDRDRATHRRDYRVEVGTSNGTGVAIHLGDESLPPGNG